MAVTADSVIVELIAKTDGYTAKVNGAANATSAAMSQIERSASKAEAQIVRSTGAIANAQRNLGRQISDIGVGLAGGQSPFLILAQQAPQVADALADTGGRAARVASFFAGPWGAALLAAGSIAGVLAEKLLGTAKAHDELKRAADAAAEAERLLQGVIGGTIDQTEKARVASLDRARALTFEARAALNNAQAQLALARAYAAASAETERRGGTGLGIPGRGAASSAIIANNRQIDVQIAQTALNAAEIRLRNLEKVAGAARGIEEQKASDAQARKDAAEARRAAAAARRAEKEAERQAREQAQFMAQRVRGQAELASAEADLTSDTRLQDEALRMRIKADRDAAIAGIQADPDRTKAQKDELSAIETRIAEARLRLVNISETQRFLDETLAIQKADLATQADILNEQGNLAQTDAQRREVALRLLDLAFERERLELEAVLASKKTTEVEKQIAQKRLDQLGGLFGARREGVERNFEGPGAQYRRKLEADAGQLGNLVDEAAVDGLASLNNELTDAILNSKSLGEAFHNTARQIVADLLRIAIQQAVIKPLANALFGGEGGGGSGLGSLLGSAASAAGAVFGGGPQGNPAGILSIFGRASGGYVAPGQTVRVNEGTGRTELLRMGGQGGTVIPLGQTRAAQRAGNTTIVQHISVDGRNSVTPAGFAGQILDEADRRASQAISQNNGTIRKSLPAAQDRYAKLGTTG